MNLMEVFQVPNQTILFIDVTFKMELDLVTKEFRENNNKNYQ